MAGVISLTQCFLSVYNGMRLFGLPQSSSPRKTTWALLFPSYSFSSPRQTTWTVLIQHAPLACHTYLYCKNIFKQIIWINQLSIAAHANLWTKSTQATAGEGLTTWKACYWVKLEAPCETFDNKWRLILSWLHALRIMELHMYTGFSIENRPGMILCSRDLYRPDALVVFRTKVKVGA